MRDRLTARVLLFDPAGAILLLRGRMPGHPASSSAWHTVGGGVDPGETLIEAARREVAEESGFTEVDLGPVVWTRSGAGVLVTGEQVLFKEHYFVGLCPGGEPSRAGWADYETDLIDDIRWWTPLELAGLTERIYPERFLELFPGIAAGVYPDPPLEITVTRLTS
ncbi:NUDIX domain-containing protein [Phenylobacterium sp. LH3H17]|uniref:NUDIX hydrolase n=1 Tax=Phenylobacterium sp. LH3H17 TaxID=2903901 RepID=UPI0020C98421|nr:NUDIX domain-containing protein [Phenylobacterium sp. LH3H17]UTP40794.1 NUDIX domain-containing protein [Phenylobacterium sp. LH3H17]